ncbi:WD40 repeat domain-containing protein [Trichormus azollae]|jgi:WD40 repeat protein|uniref:WD40 repeat domain-containing protein n=1 Tax=Trichormus azollae TaxID=1164 RepID=UPI0001956D48|nr:WD40 repeat domain-containing protein [Trichormus azollae]
MQVDYALQRVILTIQEHNRLTGYKAAVLGVHISPNGEQIATASVDKTVIPATIAK